MRLFDEKGNLTTFPIEHPLNQPIDLKGLWHKYDIQICDETQVKEENILKIIGGD